LLTVDPHIPITQDLLKLIAELDEFKGRWHALKTHTPERLTALHHVASIESAGASTRIEGATLTNVEVETLLTNLTITPFTTRDEQEVAGYAEAMDLILQSYSDLPVTENHIKQLHSVLLRHSHKDERHRGSYKTLDNHVVAKAPDGQVIGIVFNTTSPFNTPHAIETLVAWQTKADRETPLHPLLTIAVVIVVFLAIHPFQDGNGRLSRLLTTLLLLRAGYDYVPYASLERVIEDNKDLYYRALRRTQTTLQTDSPDWTPWVGFFLRCLKQQKDALLEQLT
jgi:Fic family protein